MSVVSRVRRGMCSVTVGVALHVSEVCVDVSVLSVSVKECLGMEFIIPCMRLLIHRKV